LKRDDKILKVVGSEVKIFGGMRVLTWSYSNVVCIWVTVQYVLLLSHCYLLYVLCSLLCS